MKKKCKVPCDKLHRMDRNIRRIIWKNQAFKQGKLQSDHMNVIVDAQPRGLFHATTLILVPCHSEVHWIEPTLDMAYFTRPTICHIGIIRAKKF